MFNFFWSYQQEQSAITTIKYGALYNWYAANDGRGISSGTMNLPSFVEFNTLTTYLGGSSIAGGKLKEIGFVYWSSPNTGATNEFLFNGRGSGKRTSGSFGALNIETSFHTNYSGSIVVSYSLYYDNATFTQITGSFKNVGLPIRLVRSATTDELLLPDGLISATYTGNDGKIYRCVKIGTQIWTADNLAETKFANGDWIHGYDSGTYTPIANATWAALTTDGMCFYNDDPTTYL